jgi:ferrous iron transport protein A
MGVRGMDGTVMGDVRSDSTARVHVTGAQLPLAMVHEGETVTVAKVRGGQDLRQHLAELGFVPGGTVKVVSRVNGDVIVGVKGATFGIGRDMAMRIVTC